MDRGRIITTSKEETIAFGKALAARVRPGSVVCFFGDLGSGKTTLIKGIVHALTGCPPEVVCSPTYSYLNVYEGHLPVYHFDLYRLNDEDAFLSMGFDEYLNAHGVCCIEWSERIASLLPIDAVRLSLSHLSEDNREIMYEIS